MSGSPIGMETEHRCSECEGAFLVRRPDDRLECPGCGHLRFSEAQRETVAGISPMGFHLNKGTPCECGPEEYSTSKEVGYSDFVTYTHRCGSCGNEFETYIEG